ncbi:MAG: protein kinase [Acidobacteriales bacterium]|nr:protein kinase [Terriglobales bacterium]
MAVPASMLGRVLGHYTLFEQIGAGGMGVVYRAHDLRLNRDVAIKVLAPGLLHDDSSRKRFRHEAEILSRFSHPNVAHVYDFDTQDNLDFIVMEFVEGQVLSKLAQRGPAPEAQVIEIGRQVASALNEAHTTGIVHCDVKSANLMLTVKGQVKLLDFGLARLVRLRDWEQTATLVDDWIARGTLPYMAPEQIAGQPCSPGSDVYSLGVVLYELATGRLPFQNSSRLALMNDIVNKAPESPANLRPELSVALVSVILRGMEKSPATRYQTCAEMESALAVVESALGTERADHSWLWSSLGMMALVLLLAGFLWWGWPRKAVSSEIPDVRQVAVLPLIRAGTSAQAAAFANGLIETVTSRLAKLSSKHHFSVVPASDMRDKDVSSLEQANREFGANLGLELSVEQVGERVRVNYALVDIKEHRQLDGDTITTAANDPFALEDQVSESVINALELKLEPEEKKQLLLADTPQPAAHDFYLQGRGYLQSSSQPSTDSAITEFKNAIIQDPDYGLAYAGLGEAYWSKYVQTRERSWIPQASAACQRATTLSPSTGTGQYCLAQIAEGTGDYQEAIGYYQHALQADPDDSRNYTGLATAYESSGRTDAAEATYRNAIRAKPNDWAAYNVLGDYYFRHGKLDKAAELFRQVIALAPDGAQGYTNVGIALLQQGDYRNAITYLQRSVDIEAVGDNVNNLAMAYFFGREYTKAARTFERAAAISAGKYELWSNLGDAYYWAPGERGRADAAYQKAIELGKECLTVNAKDRTALLYVAQDYAMTNNQRAATSYLRKAESAGNPDGDFFTTAAIVYVQAGDREKALDYLEKAIAAGVTSSSLRDTPNFDTLRVSTRFQKMIEGQSLEPRKEVR